MRVVTEKRWRGVLGSHAWFGDTLKVTRTEWVGWWRLWWPVKRRVILLLEDEEWTTNAVLPDPLNPGANQARIDRLFARVWELRRKQTVAFYSQAMKKNTQGIVAGFGDGYVKVLWPGYTGFDVFKVQTEHILGPEEHAGWLMAI